MIAPREINRLKAIGYHVEAENNGEGFSYFADLDYHGMPATICDSEDEAWAACKLHESRQSARRARAWANACGWAVGAPSETAPHAIWKWFWAHIDGAPQPKQPPSVMVPVYTAETTMKWPPAGGR